jgi:gamma-glutamylcysteine synthetase
MAFQQAPLQVQKTEEFDQLKAVIERVFAQGVVEKFYRKLQSRDVRVREFEKVLEQRIFEEMDSSLSQSSKAAKQFYSSLPISDRSLIRELYLERIEQVDPRVREKFQKIYRYY